MEEIPKENIVDKIYKLRKNFVVIGLTGRTGSGCSTVAKLLSTQNPEEFKSEYREVNSNPIDNDVRKNRIIYRYILKNWRPFTVIKASDIIFYYALLQTFDDFSRSLAKCSNDANSEGKFSDSDSERSREIQNDLQKVKSRFEELSAIARECDNFLEKDEIKDNRENTSKYLELILKGIPNFRDELGKALEKSKKILSDELQTWGNNIRVYDSIIAQKDGNQSENAPSCLARKINQFLKLIRYDNERDGKPTLIAIDALRNPYEVLYFRERYSAFYLMSINTTEQIRKQKLFEQGYRNDEIILLDKREGEKKDFKSQYTGLDIDKCIELSDIHITHDGTEYTNNRKLTNQIITYISLMLHPGLVPPSPIERVMQVAYTAKLNSGCLSRQVGAAVTNEAFSIFSIGWNTVAEGQTPCSLRSLSDLVEKEDQTAYSTYEKQDVKFQNYIKRVVACYGDHHVDLKFHDKDILKGINLTYCFKDIHNSRHVTGQIENQVHTRSLHAEENAFLQLAKYGSSGIKGGKLFSTACCCELCAKKAYQLGIKEIYYIDSYPGISQKHILECGDNRPEMILFHGAVGRAYVSLFNPFLSLKDEIEEVTGVHVKDIETDKDDQLKYSEDDKSNN